MRTSAHPGINFGPLSRYCDVLYTRYISKRTRNTRRDVNRERLSPILLVTFLNGMTRVRSVITTPRALWVRLLNHDMWRTRRGGCLKVMTGHARIIFKTVKKSCFIIIKHIFVRLICRTFVTTPPTHGKNPTRGTSYLLYYVY